MSLKLIVFSWQLLTASPHPSPKHLRTVFTEWSLGTRGNQDGAFNIMAPLSNTNFK